MNHKIKLKKEEQSQHISKQILNSPQFMHQLSHPLQILVTRPRPEGEALCKEIQAIGGHPIFFPTIEIASPPLDDIFYQQISDLSSYEWAIFISPQAVRQSLPHIKQLPKQVGAIGLSTAMLLHTAQIKVDAYPSAVWTSEAFLALSPFQHLANKKIALIKGEGGRDLLCHTLASRGAKVTEIIAYRRVLPDVDTSELLKLLQCKPIDVILCTSVESLVNLKKLLGTQWHNLKKILLIVISERIKIKAYEWGFETIFVAKNASNTALLEAIRTLLKDSI